MIDKLIPLATRYYIRKVFLKLINIPEDVYGRIRSAALVMPSIRAYSAQQLPSKNKLSLFLVESLLSTEDRSSYHPIIIEHLKRVYKNTTQPGLIVKAIDYALVSGDVDLADKILSFGMSKNIFPTNKTNRGVITRASRNLYIAKGQMSEYLACFQFSSKNKLIKRYLPEKWVEPDEIDTLLEGNGDIAIIATLGPGDELAFSPIYAEIIADKRVDHQRLKITCDYRLYGLFSRTYPELTFIPSRLNRHIDAAHPLSLYDQLPEISLHKLFCNESFAAVKDCTHFIYNLHLLSRYADSLKKGKLKRALVPDANKVAHFEKRLEGHNKLIGLTWRSSISAVSRDHNLLRTEQLRPLFEKTKENFVNIQYDDTSQDQIWIEENFPGRLISFNDIDMYNDFESVVALITCLDAAITPPTSVAQLTSKAGCKTLLLCNTYVTARDIAKDGVDPHMLPIENYMQVYGNPVGDKSKLVARLAHIISEGKF